MKTANLTVEMKSQLQHAGYTNSAGEFTGIIKANGIPYHAAAAEWDKGMKRKRAGLRCNCSECQGRNT